LPTYQYRCTSCGNELEAVQKFTDPALTECPQCQGRLRKIYNAVGVVFKGSGFYRTDSRASATKPEGDASGGTAPAASGQGDGASTSGATTGTPAPAPAGKEKSQGSQAASSTKASAGAKTGTA
jgi:putative FmdB family regulatory protein